MAGDVDIEEGEDVIDLLSVITRAISQGKADMHTGMPAKVESYDAATQKVSVQPVIKGRYEDGETFDEPIIPDVPLCYPSGAGYMITWPLEKGDYVMLVFAERSIDEWLDQGGDGKEAQSLRRFDAADAVAIPGIRPFAEPLEGTGENLIVGEQGSPGHQLVIDKSGSIEITDGTAKCNIAGGKILLGSNSVNALDVLNDLISALQSAVTATAIGPQPLDPGTQATLVQLATQLGTIKQ